MKAIRFDFMAMYLNTTDKVYCEVKSVFPCLGGLGGD